MSSLSELDRQRMEEIAFGLPTKSEKIRRLAAAGFQRADIARFLDIRYQHVRNVLVAPRPKRTTGTPSPDKAPNAASPPQGTEAAVEPEHRWVWTTVGKGGRVDIPASLLAAMGLAEGDPIQISLDGGVARILPRDAVLREVQTYVRRHVPEDVSLVDELLAERRLEAGRDE